MAAVAAAAALGVPRFSYTVLYVRDVQKSLDFYSQAFGFKTRRLDHSRKWGELESGPTTIAFTPLQQREASITGGVHAATRDEQRPNIELSFSYNDLDAAFQHALEHGAELVAVPELKSWGQKVGYVRDLDGIVIRLGSHVHEPSHHQEK